jgi:O-methyltransferase
MKILHRCLQIFNNAIRNRRHAQIYKRFSKMTMIGQQSFSENLQLAEQVEKIVGSVVECGVWRGGMSAGIATILGPDRKYYLFDSFEGLPPAKPMDGSSALAWQRNTDSNAYFDNCRAPQHFCEQAMDMSGAKNVQIIKGWFNETLSNFTSDQPIALLRLDGDWYDSTISCLENLYDKVNPGGVIIIDDYYTWDGCSRAVHDFLSGRAATERIRCYGGVCYLTKCGSN